jgi:tetratricopeptide (TPR) repeat protein
LNTVEQILQSGDNLMDVHRVYAYALESTGQYLAAVAEYDKAIAITPNLTFLYLRAGANWRKMGFDLYNETGEIEQARPLYNNSLDYFAKATRINERLGVKDPAPYISISNTYSQMGEYFIAGRNVQKALEFQPQNAEIYGRLGIVYFKSRNYEGSIPALKCAVEGCTADESCEGRGGCGRNDVPAQVTGLPLSSDTVVYYYTYGSVLAALSRPAQNYCPKALSVFNQISAVFNDNDILTIIQAGETICASLGQETAVPQVTATPQITPTP